MVLRPADYNIDLLVAQHLSPMGHKILQENGQIASRDALTHEVCSNDADGGGDDPEDAKVALGHFAIRIVLPPHCCLHGEERRGQKIQAQRQDSRPKLSA